MASVDQRSDSLVFVECTRPERASGVVLAPREGRRVGDESQIRIADGFEMRREIFEGCGIGLEGGNTRGEIALGDGF